jgi:hypothetical protein
MQDLINTWKEGKENVNASGSTEAIIRNAKAKKNEVLYAHYGTIIILVITLVLLALFYFKTPFKELMSHAGMWLMMATLLLRIVVEVISIVKSRSIQLTSNAEQVTKAALAFYDFRKTVHGPVTLAIVGCYVIGFYLLTPEFSKYISFGWMVAMHVSFVIGAVFLIWVIKKGIRKEIASIEYLSGMRDEIISNEEQNV